MQREILENERIAVQIYWDLLCPRAILNTLYYYLIDSSQQPREAGALKLSPTMHVGVSPKVTLVLVGGQTLVCNALSLCSQLP